MKNSYFLFFVAAFSFIAFSGCGTPLDMSGNAITAVYSSQGQDADNTVLEQTENYTEEKAEYIPVQELVESLPQVRTVEDEEFGLIEVDPNDETMVGRWFNGYTEGSAAFDCFENSGSWLGACLEYLEGTSVCTAWSQISGVCAYGGGGKPIYRAEVYENNTLTGAFGAPK